MVKDWIFVSLNFAVYSIFILKLEDNNLKNPNSCEVKIDLMGKKEQWRALGTAGPGCLTE